MITTDPDMEPLLDVDDKIRDEVRQKLDELVRREHETAVDRPSLRRFLNHQLGFSEAAAKDADLDQSRGLPFRSLYQRGFRFSWDKERYEHYDGRWFAADLAYLYYRLQIGFATRRGFPGNWFAILLRAPHRFGILRSVGRSDCLCASSRPSTRPPHLKPSTTEQTSRSSRFGKRTFAQAA
jgi:hypothetical protein